MPDIDIDIPLEVSADPVDLDLTIDAEYNTPPEYSGPFEFVTNSGFQVVRVGGKFVPRDIIIYPSSR